MSHPLDKPCPVCGAAVGQRCQGRRGDRKSFHRKRGSKRDFKPIKEVEHGLSESPIEDLLYSVLVEWLEHALPLDCVVETQAPVGPYRVDLLVTAAGQKLVVEADGVAFHNSTEAIERDKRRDRYCAMNGYQVMRFTGQEIVRDPRGCAAEIGAWIMAQ